MRVQCRAAVRRTAGAPSQYPWPVSGKFPLSRFQVFCANLLIDSKERGQLRLTQNNLLTTQKYFVEQVVSGIEEGIHTFVILKGRQEGITTICAALDLFWHYEYPGMQGTFAAHEEEARDKFRAMLTMYHGGLPKKFRQPVLQNNRYFISWKNRSLIQMQIGGSSKKKGSKGRGSGIIYIHATECSSWEDEESLSSIKASLAQKNPNRLAIFESTARGFNMFHSELWKPAKRAVTQRAIFIGWWLNELYRKEKDSAEYRCYWDGRPTPQEREWLRAIKIFYGADLEPEQMAWWRWMSAEQITDETLMLQEYPPTEEHAFQLSGSSFFSVTRLEQITQAIKMQEDPKYFRFKFTDDFLETTCEETVEQMGELIVWEEPEEGAWYSIGADPAYGSSDWADGFAIEIFRCYADRFEQVAEYCVTDLSTYKFAWVLCYLAGAYRGSMINLEVNGPGQQVMVEINNLRRRAGMIRRSAASKEFTDVMSHLQYFLYRRQDSPGGAGFVYGTLTTQGVKHGYMNGFRDLLYRSHAVLHSEELLDEMKIVVLEDDGFLGASGRGKDDRVIASALAADQHNRMIVSKLQGMGVTWGEHMKRRQAREDGTERTPAQNAVTRNIRNFLNRSGIKGEEEAA